jgi:arabinosaccharide transport system substrate-binding protein
MKRFFLFVMTFILVFVLTTASVSPQGKTTTLTFWTFQEEHARFFNDAVEAWNAANPAKQIELKIESYAYEEAHNKLLIALQAGTGAPDMADIEESMFSNFLKGINLSLIPLNDIVEPVLDKCVKSRFDIYSKEGKYYGIDYHVGATVMYYNTEIMDKAGVNIDDIVTIEDFVEAGKKVVAATGKPMITIETTDQWSFWPFISQQGSDYFDKNGNCILDNETNIKTLQTLVDWVYKDKIAIGTPGGNHHTEEYWTFMNNGGAASLMMPMWYMGRFINYMPDLKGKIAIRPLPTWTEGGNRSAGMGGTGTTITIQCKEENVDLAKQFLAFAKLSKEAAIKTWTVLGFDPLRWDVYDDPKMKESTRFTDYFGTGIIDVLKEVKDEVIAVNIPENFADAGLLAKTTIPFKAIKERSGTPEEVLKEAADEVRALAEK